MASTLKEKGNDIKPEICDDSTCGIGSFHPLWLQRCGNITCYSVSYGLTLLVTNALGVYISSQITTLEKQFDLSSSQSGFILSCNDIGFTLTVLFVSHFGIRYNIPRVLALFTMIYGISGVATSFLRLFSEHDMPSTAEDTRQSKNITNNFLCMPDRNTSLGCTADRDESLGYHVQIVFILLCISMGIQGFGKAPRSSLGTYYIDSNVPDKTRTGFYLGISTTMGLFGPFFAITLGGLFGKLPVDLQETSIQPSDPRWIGAWWIGFLLFGVLAIVFAIPLTLYPRKMATTESKTESKKDKLINQSCCSVMKDIPKAILRIIRKPVYTLTIVALGSTLFAVMGGFSFGPKYIENQFNIPTWKANIILGAEKLVTATLGTFLGGYLTKRFRMDRQSCIKLVIVMSFITTLLNSLNFLFGCENQHIHGSPTGIADDCACENINYMAVCDEKGQTFFSPCHAGCTQVSDANTFNNCSKTNSKTMKLGMCDTNCPYLIPYVTVQVISSFLGTLNIIPVYLIILRSTDENDRSIAFGMQSFLFALLVFIPAPIAFGSLFDSVCLDWKTSCGSKGACAIYDIEQMRYKLTSLEVGTRCVVFVLYIMIFHVAKREDANKSQNDKNVRTEIELNTI